MNELYVIRGLPGSGKSTLARKIALAVCEADQYFMMSGAYKFKPGELKEAHDQCRYRCEEYMKMGAFTIAVANTFVYRDHIQPYLDLAKRYNYQVTEITMSGPLYTNTHLVPDATIQRMREQWEK